MKSILLFLLLTVVAKNLLAQITEKDSVNYISVRFKTSQPPYGLQKIRTLVSHLKSTEILRYQLDSATYSSLTLREKFTYNMISPERFGQGCIAMPFEENEEVKIYGWLPSIEVDRLWSPRQKEFLKNNRDSIIQLMIECIARDKYIGVNFKRAIVDLNAVEMIPLVINIYDATKTDHDLLTVLMLLMAEDKYNPFVTGNTYYSLYMSENASRKSSISFNTQSAQYVIKKANDFYYELYK